MALGDRKRINDLEEVTGELNAKISEVNGKVGDISEQVQGIGSAVQEMSGLMKDILASRQPPANIPRGFDAGEQYDPQRNEASTTVGKDGDVVLVQPIKDEKIDIRPPDQEKVALLAMNEEIVEVFIHDSQDPNAEQVFEIEVNGQHEIFRRGESKRVKRKFLEGLARARPMGYRNVEYVDTDGIQKVKYPGQNTLRYPFDVRHDPNPRGRDWLRNIMQQPT